MAYRLGVDVGGTFTDHLLVHEDTGDPARCQEETGLEPPVPQEPLPWAPMVTDRPLSGSPPQKRSAVEKV